MMQPGSRPIALFAVLLVCFFALIAGCMAVSGGVTVQQMNTSHCSGMTHSRH